ncbi:major facilitator superfamily transporter [Diplodia corticola]|uniref:Major facilitator superfamily transporter n=1 Tax=Diplodia corticola TaxID=236234 RepID=A0A1J9S6I9_9PEZI|nr:major facilitator superfamily transporter [Diplodia corticola]OJD35229.1 major facilitator superfamily transporter [Diplodia corticola]
MATADHSGSVPTHDHTESRGHDEDTVQAAGENVAPDRHMPAEDHETSEARNETTTTDVEAAAAEPAPPPIHSVFSKKTKLLIITMTTMASFFSPVSGQIYLPALNTLAKEFHVSLADINFTVTSYMIFQGIAPMFFGDLADQLGRRPTYICCFVIFFFANLGLALQRNYAALLVLRAMQSSGSSGVIALGNGVISDVTTSAERGSYVAWVQMGTQLGPALGPILGGVLAQFLGWPSIFWFLAISGGVYLILYIILIPETGRNVVGDGSLPPQGWNKSLLNIIAERRRKKNGLERTVSRQAKHEESKRLAAGRHLRFPNPFQALRIVVEKDVSLILLALSILMTGFFCMIVPMPGIFASTYGFNDLQIGLCYIPFSAGAMLGSLACGRFLDHNFRRVAAKHGITVDRKRASSMRNFPIERARLEIIWAPLVIGSLSTLVWGWVLRAQTSLAAPLVILFIGGAMLSGTMSMLMTLLVDLYPQRASTAMAGLNLCRCSMSATGTASVEYIIRAWGLGWTYTFLGLLMLVGSIAPLAVVVWKGPRWREDRFLRMERKEKKDKEERKTLDGGVRRGDGGVNGVEERVREELEEGEREEDVGPQQSGGDAKADGRK